MAVVEHTGKNPYLTVCKKLGFKRANWLGHCANFRHRFSSNLPYLAKGGGTRDKPGIKSHPVHMEWLRSTN